MAYHTRSLGINYGARILEQRRTIHLAPAKKSEPLRKVYVAAESGKVSINKAPPKPISLSDAALNHLNKLQTERGETKTVLRVGVKSGGCSGMSYVMDFITTPEELKQDDVILEEGNIEIRIDPKSLLYLFGLTLDYSDELIGGGYKFFNPNAASSCGCGTSFNV